MIIVFFGSDPESRRKKSMSIGGAQMLSLEGWAPREKWERRRLQVDSLGTKIIVISWILSPYNSCMSFLSSFFMSLSWAIIIVKLANVLGLFIFSRAQIIGTAWFLRFQLSRSSFYILEITLFIVYSQDKIRSQEKENSNGKGKI